MVAQPCLRPGSLTSTGPFILSGSDSEAYHDLDLQACQDLPQALRMGCVKRKEFVPSPGNPPTEPSPHLRPPVSKDPMESKARPWECLKVQNLPCSSWSIKGKCSFLTLLDLAKLLSRIVALIYVPTGILYIPRAPTSCQVLVLSGNIFG